MALARHALEALAPHIRGASVLSLGYPDILCTADEAEEIFGVKPLQLIDAGSQHGVERPLVETMKLFEMVDAKLDCIDVVRWRGFERLLDLNEPHDLGQYDLVIDPGTTEHCFNIGQAVMNGARAVKPGGRIYHSLPMTMINHGFYNVCPTMLWDFYAQNGWEIELYEVRNQASNTAVQIAEKGAHARRVTVSMECGMICLARRTSGAELRWPIQQKYVAMLDQAKRAA